MNGAVVDASVAIKWVIDEPGSSAAAALLSAGPLRAPDLLLVECANVLWKKVRRGELSADEAGLAIRVLRQADIELLPSRPLADRALQLALELDHSAYDCLYLALALESGQPFVTADDRFVRRIAEAGLAPGVVTALAPG
jgi:predicted nucleic acid-binding protein